MRSGEFTGHSIDEAVFHGLQELGLSIDEVNIETLQTETKGLFGIGAKLARVRLTEREPEEVEAIQQEQRAKSEQQRERRPRDREERGGGRSRDRGEDRGGRDWDRGGDRRRRPEREDGPPRPQYPYDAALAKEHPAGQFLQELLDKMSIKSEVLLCETEDGIRIRIDSQTRGLLIGRRGETLDALQYITSLHVNRSRKQDKYLRITLDTEDYRSKREDTLTKLARRQAARVKASGKPVSMEPMNPYERRVLHSSLQNNPFVTTHSEGEEPNRRVVISPKR